MKTRKRKLGGEVLHCTVVSALLIAQESRDHKGITQSLEGHR